MNRAAAGGSEREEDELEARHITSRPDLRPYPRRVTPTPISSTSFLE
jgi:hypothetical protein